MKAFRVRFAIFIFTLAPILAYAGGDEAVVIYNKRVSGSEEVAKYYAKMRHVPKSQIYGFSLTPNEEMSRVDFRDSLQLPLARRLEHDGLWKFGPVKIPATNGQPERIEEHVVRSKIRYLVLCYGMPLKIAPDPNINEPAAEKLRPELRRNEAAVDSELVCLPLVHMDVPLSGPLPNWVYGVTNEAQLNPTNGILLVARLDGPTPEIARGLVDKALQAEKNGLWGRAYFDARGLDKTNSYFLGDEWMLEGASICRQL